MKRPLEENQVKESLKLIDSMHKNKDLKEPNNDPVCRFV
jgi:hypothetical protein